MENEDDNRETCPECGEKCDSVETGIDPYALEINDEEIEMTACEECFYQRRMDI